MRNSTGACYTLNKRILTNYLSANKPPLVYITARSGSCGEVVMAIFNTVPQADLWIELTYGSSRKGIVPTFKDDELTLGYHKEHGYKLKMGKTRVRGKLKQRFKGITL